jgi:hypothetical protein
VCVPFRVFLQFDGVNNAFYVWVNGKPVGYSQDSCLPAEFDVSKFLQEGKNLISVQVPLPHPPPLTHLGELLCCLSMEQSKGRYLEAKIILLGNQL